MLLSYTGRATGLSRTTPVSYVQYGDDLLVPAGGAWWKNLASGAMKIRLRGKWQIVTAEVISEATPLAQALGRMMRANPLVSIFTGIRLGADELPIPESLERERKRGFVVVRFRLTEGSATPSSSAIAAYATISQMVIRSD